MSAIRLARAATARDLIVKFDGCYHGHADSLLVKAGSGLLTLGIPGSPGVPEALARLTVSLPYNDVAACNWAFAEFGDRVAAIIVEPVAGNMNCVLPQPGFLQVLRDLCTHYGALLIFDEVITGFRVALGGAQALFGVTPDLTTLGKIIGGGLPVGAFGGSAKYMDMVAPLGPVYQAGTLSGNPLAVRAGLAMLSALRKPGVYEQLAATTTRLATGIERVAAGAGVRVAVTHVCGMLGLYFTDLPAAAIHSYKEVATADVARFQRFFHALLDRGVYLAPSAFESAFVSLTHTDAVVDATLTAMGEAFAELARGTP